MRARSQDERAKTTPSQPNSAHERSPFDLAGERLVTLLAGVRNSQDSVFDEVEGYTPDQRLTLLANAGALMSVLAFFVCFLAREDPLGGMTLSPSSLEAAALGLAFGLPLVACSAFGHSKVAKEAFPVLEEFHSAQRELVAPMISGMTLGQLAALFGFVALPCLMLLLPAFKGSFDAFEYLITTAVLTPKALIGSAAPPGAAAAAPHLPHAVRLLLPSVLSAYTAGIVVATSLGVRRSELAAVRDAMRSAERWFRLDIAERRGAAVVTGDGAAAPPGTPPSAAVPPAAAGEGEGAVTPAAVAASASASPASRSAAQAFRLVAAVWLLERFQVSRLGFVLSSLNVCYLYMIWMATLDLTTPAAAALLHFAAEVFYSLSEQRRIEQGARERNQQWRTEMESKRREGPGGGGGAGDGGNGGSAV